MITFLKTRLAGDIIFSEDYDNSKQRVFYGWNLRTDGQSHAGAFTPFCSLVSGFSQNLLKMFLSGKILEFKAPTPWDTVTLVLEDERYKKVRVWR